MPILPQAAQENATHDASTIVVASKTIPDQFFGTLTFELIGELSGTPATTYSYTNKAIVSCDLGLVTVQYQGTPEIIDPASAAPTVTIDASGQNVQLKVLGFAAQDWRWAGKISGLNRTEWDESLIDLLYQAQIWYEADFTNATIDSSVEPQLFTTIPNHGLLGGTFGSAGAVRPAVGNIESNGNLRRVVGFNGSNYQDSSLAASNFKFMHDGTGCTTFYVHKSFTTTNTHYVAVTCPLGNANIGCIIFEDIDNSRCGIHITNGTAAVLNSLQTPAGSVTEGQPHVFVSQHGTARTLNALLRVDGVNLTEANYLVSPSTASPTSALRIGSSTAGNLFVSGDIAAFISYNALLTAQQIVLVENYLAQKYCRPSTIMRQAPTVWLNPALSNAARLDPAAAPTAVDRVWDASGKAHDAVQATDAREESLNPASAGFGNQKTLLGSAVASQGYGVYSGVGWSADTGHSVLHVLKQTRTPVVNTYVGLASEGTNQRFGICGGSGAGGALIERMGLYDGVQRNVARAQQGPALLEWHVATGGTVTGYNNGVLVGSSVCVARAFSGAVMLNNDQFFSSPSIEESAECLDKTAVAGTPLTGTALWETRESLVSKYGLTWNSALIPDHVSIIDPRVSDSITTAGGAVSRVNSQHANIDVIADGSCEAAGVTAWTANNLAALTKSATTPYAGSLSLQIAYGGNNAPLASQAVTVIGQTYRVRCQMWGDGGAGIPRVQDGVTLLWEGTNAAAWQAVDVTYVATATSIYFGSAMASAGFVRLDAVSLENVTAGVATQSVAGSQPSHNEADDYFLFDGSADCLSWVTPTAAGTIWGYVYVDSTSGANPRLFECESAGPIRCGMVRVTATGLLTVEVGSTSTGTGIAVPVNGWTTFALTWSGTTMTAWIGAQGWQGTFAGALPAIPIFIAADNASGTAANWMKGRIGVVGAASRALSVRELMREFVQNGTPYGFSLPAAMVPSDWDSQLCGCWDPSVTTAGGPVSAWADRLARPGKGATSPGAASTYPQHSVIDNSVSFDGTDDYMQWIVVPNRNQGSLEMWFTLSALPGAGTHMLFGVYDGATLLDCWVTSAGGVSFRVGITSGSATNLITAGTHHLVLTWTNGADTKLTLDGITTVLAGAAGIAPNAPVYLGCRNDNPLPGEFTAVRIAKASINSSAISVAQAVSNFVNDYDTIVNKVGV